MLSTVPSFGDNVISFSISNLIIKKQKFSFKESRKASKKHMPKLTYTPKLLGFSAPGF